MVMNTSHFSSGKKVAHRFLGLSYSGSCAGGIVVAPVMNYLVEHYGWQVTVLSAAGYFSSKYLLLNTTT